MQMLNTIIEVLHHGGDELVQSFANSQTLIVAGVGFLAITWAFPQIIFPRLKRLDQIQDELLAFAIKVKTPIDSSEHSGQQKEEEHAEELNSIFLKYETAYQRAAKLVKSASSGYVFITALMLLLTSKSLLLTMIYAFTLVVIIYSIIKSYPSINKVRSVKFLIDSMGFNPWSLWGLMMPGIFFSSNPRSWLTDSDQIHIILRQRVFVTGWRYYVQVSNHSNSRVWVISSGCVTVGKHTDKEFTAHGVHYYQSIARFNHSQLDVPLRNKAREFKAGIMMFIPVFKNDTHNPFTIKDYAEINTDVRDYLGSGASLNSGRVSSASAVEVRGVGDKFKIKLDQKVILDTVSKDIFKELLKCLNGGISLKLSDKDGHMLQLVKSRRFKLISAFYRVFRFVKLPPLSLGKFDDLTK